MPGFPARPRAVRTFRRMLEGLILLFVLVLCSQCRRIAPGVTGVDLRVNAGVNADGHCMRECAKRQRGERREEQRRFVRALRACGGAAESFPAPMGPVRWTHAWEAMVLPRSITSWAREQSGCGEGGTVRVTLALRRTHLRSLTVPGSQTPTDETDEG